MKKKIHFSSPWLNYMMLMMMMMMKNGIHQQQKKCWWKGWNLNVKKFTEFFFCLFVRLFSSQPKKKPNISPLSWSSSCQELGNSLAKKKIVHRRSLMTFTTIIMMMTTMQWYILVNFYSFWFFLRIHLVLFYVYIQINSFFFVRD